MTTAPVLNRRDFLKTGAAGSAALVVGFHLPSSALASTAEEQEKQPVNPFNAWVRVTPDNQVTLILGKSEMGQGIMTALPMILAEELSLDWQQVKIEQAPTNPKIYDHGTGGSGSVAASWTPLRQAGAAAREMLVTAAAQRWNVNRDTCRAQNGGVLHGARKQFLTYGQLAEDAAKLPLPDFKTVPLKNSSDFTIVGHDHNRFEARAKSTGAAKFGIDSRPDGLLYAVIARCPVFGGKPATFEATKAKAVPGVRDVFSIDPVAAGAFTSGGVVVLADNSWAAMQGRKALDITWDEGPNANESSESLRQHFIENASRPGKAIINQGDADAALAAAAKKVDVVYELPFAAHACMEPMNCTVQIGPDRAEAWVPTQAPQWAQDVIAGVSKLPHESVVVHTTLMGGGFGRRYQADFVMEAAQVAKAIGNKPVMVLWTREDDMQHDFYRPASYHHMQGGVDAQKDLAVWKHFQTSTSIAAVWSKDGQEKPDQSEFATAAFIPYRAKNYRVEYTLAKSGVPRAWWRSVEHSSSGFVVECFIDELAAAAGVDPLEFRLRMIGDARKIQDATSPEGKPLDTARLKGVLQLAAEKAGWGKPLPAGVGRGIAGYYSFESYTAGVAEVSVKDGQVRIDRIVYAVDCGRPINPNGIAAQVEGAAIYGLSAAMNDAITIHRGRVAQANFNDYQMPRIHQTPKIEVHVVQSKEEPTGIGEPGLPVIAPAVCNAIFAVTGKRVRRLPILSADLA
jgi:isoquinoline 1-oxidoreductase beta subunit